MSMDTIDAVLYGAARALDPVGYIDVPPAFEVEKSIRRGGLTVEAGHVEGWPVLRYSRHGALIGVGIIAYSDEYFVLKGWGDIDALEQGLSGIMRMVA